MRQALACANIHTVCKNWFVSLPFLEIPASWGNKHHQLWLPTFCTPHKSPCICPPYLEVSGLITLIVSTSPKQKSIPKLISTYAALINECMLPVLELCRCKASPPPFSLHVLFYTLHQEKSIANNYLEHISLYLSLPSRYNQYTVVVLFDYLLQGPLVSASIT